MLTQQALQKRINRRLAHRFKIYKSRSAWMKLDCGEYYMVEKRSGDITDTHVDLEHLGRELGVLLEGQTVAL